MRFFFSLPYFLIVIINVVKVYKIITKVIINIKMNINENNILNINKSSFLTIIIILISNNNIK